MSACFHKIHDYLVGEQIATGSFSSIWKAYHKETFEPVAVKLVSKNKMKGYDSGKTIQFNECYLAPLLVHPHIVPIHETIETKGQIFQVMDFEGSDLLHYMVKKKISLQEKYRISDEILSAVEYLHNHQIAHLDIKLENILLSEDLEVKLCDFGFASLNINLISWPFGSEHYAAPEIYDNKPYDGIKADLWSIGVLLYAVFAGELPFQNRPHDPAEVDFSKIPDDIAMIVKKLLVLNPNERPLLTEVRKTPAFATLPCRVLNSPLDFFEPISQPNAMVTSRVSDILHMKLKDVYAEIGFAEPSVSKVFYYLVQSSLEFEGITYESMKLNGPYSCPQSCPVIEFPDLVNSLNPVEVITTKRDQSSVSRFIRDFLIRRKFCLSISLNGVRTAILNKPDTDLKIQINCKNLGSDTNITISSDDEKAPEVQEIICALRQTLNSTI